MNYKDQIKLIQKVSGLTQEDIAYKLGITFSALNRWLNDKSVPRISVQKKINNLYVELLRIDENLKLLMMLNYIYLKRKKRRK